MGHAIASPSSAEKWLNCANSLAAELGQPDTAGAAAALGTAKHALLAFCLEVSEGAYAHIGEQWEEVTVDMDFARDVQTVIDCVRERIALYESLGYRVEMDLEQALPIGHITGEEGAEGTGDIVLRCFKPEHSFFEVIDAKFGYNRVDPSSPQLKMYGLGVLEKFGLVDEFDEARFAIAQPALSDELIDGEPMSVEALEEWGFEAGRKAQLALRLRDAHIKLEYPFAFENYTVTEKGCMWCKAAAVCPARIKHVEETIGVDFETIEETPPDASLIPVSNLGSVFSVLETIEDWIKAVRGRVESELFSGTAIPGLKVVAGKRGNRQWNNENDAEALMKKFGLKQDQMYSKKLLGPKPILDLLKDQPRRLKQIEVLVVQKDGKPHVALDTDKRPALEIKPADSGFNTVD